MSNTPYLHKTVEKRIVDTKNGHKHDKRLLAMREWEDVGEILDFVSKCPEDSHGGRRSTHKKGRCHGVDEDTEKGWRFGSYKNLDRTRKALNEGRCPKLVQTYIDEYKNKLKADGLYNTPDELKDSVKRRRVWHEEGAELDIDAVMSGDPNYWVKTVRNGKMRIVRLVINYSFSCGNSYKESAKLLGLTYCVAEILEQLGYGVEIYGSQMCWSPVSDISEQGSIVPLKTVQQPLDLQRIGSASITGLFRYFGFIMDNELFGNYNGYCRPTSKEMLAFIGADVLIETSWLGGNQTTKVQKIIDRLKGVSNE